MYFHKINKTQQQLEVMISVLEKEYGVQSDDRLSELIAKYFDVDEQDAVDSLQAYRAMINEDLEYESNKVEYAR